MAGKEESPIAKYKKASEHSEELSDTWQQHHHGAFHHAVEKVLKNKKTGRIEYKRLDELLFQRLPQHLSSTHP